MGIAIAWLLVGLITFVGWRLEVASQGGHRVLDAGEWTANVLCATAITALGPLTYLIWAYNTRQNAVGGTNG